MRCGHDMAFGAHLREGGGASFRLWAPAARQAELAIEGDGRTAAQLHAASVDDQGWWECTVPQAGAVTLYRWRIDGALLVPDPASRHNPQGPHGASRVVDAGAFEWDSSWTGRPWHDTVLYELHVGAFTPEGCFDEADAPTYAPPGRLQLPSHSMALLTQAAED